MALFSAFFAFSLSAQCASSSASNEHRRANAASSSAFPRLRKPPPPPPPPFLSVNMADAAAAALGASLAGILSKHKQQTISIKAARSWQFRAKRGVNDSWAKIAKKKSLSGAASSSTSSSDLLQIPEANTAAGNAGGDEHANAVARQERKLRYEKQKAEEKTRADALRAKIVSEVSAFDMDDSVTFDELFAREVVKAVDSLRTRQESDSDSSSDDDDDGGGGDKRQSGKSSKGKASALSLKKKQRRLSVSMSGLVKGAMSASGSVAGANNTASSDSESGNKRKKADVSALIHSVFWHIFSALERRRARPLETFRKFDADESGTITRREFLAGCNSMGYELSHTESKLIFETLDADGSGELDYRELVQHIKRAGRRGAPKNLKQHHSRTKHHHSSKDSASTSDNGGALPRLRRLHPGRAEKLSLYQRGLINDAKPNLAKKQSKADPTVDILGFGLRIPGAPDSKVYCRRADVLVARGLSLCEVGAFTEAASNFTAAINIDSHHYNAQVHLAHTLWRTNQPESALVHFLACQTIRPRSANAPFNCGVVQYRVGDLESAKASFQKALDLHHESVRRRLKNQPMPGDDVGPQAAHNLVLVERRLGTYAADTPAERRDATQRRRARELRDALQRWLSRGAIRGRDKLVDDALDRLKNAGRWPLPTAFEYSTATARKYIRGEKMLWSEAQEAKEHERMHERQAVHARHHQIHHLHEQLREQGASVEDSVFSSDGESSDEEDEDARDKRLEREYVMAVIHSLVSGEDQWDAFPMSQFKAEIRLKDNVANPHLSWAVVKARLLGGGASGGDRSGRKVVGGTTDASKNVGAASAEVSARTIPPTAEARAKRHELRKALLTTPEERTMHQIELLVRGSEYFPFLSRFSSNDLRSIWRVMRHGFVGQGETLLKEGFTPSTLNIIMSGRCWLRKKVDHECGKSRMMTLDAAEAGESVGEDELRRRLPMRTSVVASQDLEVLKLTQDEYIQTIGVVNRRDSYAKEDIIQRSRVFDGFQKDDGEIPRLALLAQRRYYKRGDVVAEIGKPASVMYLIVRGLVDAVRPVEHKTSGSKERTEFDIVIATLTFGKCIGASVVLDPFAPRYPATFKCTTAVEMLIIGKEAFDLRKITSGVMSSLERASCRSISIDACMRVIEDKRKHADNRIKVLRNFRYIAPKKLPGGEKKKSRVSKLKRLSPMHIMPVSPITTTKK